MNTNIPPPPFNCQVFSPCWCSVAGRENNPHCKTSVPIDNPLFMAFAVIVIVIYVYKLFNPNLKK